MFFREVKDFYRFFYKTSKEKRDIIFYAEHGGYFSSFEGMIGEFTDKYNKDICYITSDPNDAILKTSNPKIHSYYINKLLPFLMAFINCKVFVMTLTDLNQFHLKRSANPVHYVYVFHALVSTHMMYNNGAFDHYDSILCVGPHQIDEIRKYEEIHSLKKKKLIKAGYHRLERIYQSYKKYQKEQKSNKKLILIAPSWGKDNILELCGKPLIKILLDAGYRVIARPHPEARRRSPDLIASISSEFKDNPDFVLEASTKGDTSILEADVLVSECSGITLEYAFGTERPVLFIDTPIKIKNEKYKELDIEPLELLLRSKIGVVVSPKDLEKVPQVIEQLITEKSNYKEQIASLREKSVYSFGHSSEVGAEHIFNLADNK